MWIDSLKAKINGEVALDATRKAFLTGILEDAVAAHPTDPVAALRAFIDADNAGGTLRIKTYAQFAKSCIGEYQNRLNDWKGDPLELLDMVIQQKR